MVILGTGTCAWDGCNACEGKCIVVTIVAIDLTLYTETGRTIWGDGKRVAKVRSSFLLRS